MGIKKPNLIKRPRGIKKEQTIFLTALPKEIANKFRKE